uniref:Uncharacterized protein LOC114325311 n=1 Tax=Diabrotica virgifera virgifera TaxID=50390 RepID=A0A6P7F1E5_DIAVI
MKDGSLVNLYKYLLSLKEENVSSHVSYQNTLVSKYSNKKFKKQNKSNTKYKDRGVQVSEEHSHETRILQRSAETPKTVLVENINVQASDELSSTLKTYNNLYTEIRNELKKYKNEKRKEPVVHLRNYECYFWNNDQAHGIYKHTKEADHYSSDKYITDISKVKKFRSENSPLRTINPTDSKLVLPDDISESHFRLAIKISSDKKPVLKNISSEIVFYEENPSKEPSDIILSSSEDRLSKRESSSRSIISPLGSKAAFGKPSAVLKTYYDLILRFTSLKQRSISSIEDWMKEVSTSLLKDESKEGSIPWLKDERAEIGIPSIKDETEEDSSPWLKDKTTEIGIPSIKGETQKDGIPWLKDETTQIGIPSIKDETEGIRIPSVKDSIRTKKDKVMIPSTKYQTKKVLKSSYPRIVEPRCVYCKNKMAEAKKVESRVIKLKKGEEFTIRKSVCRAPCRLPSRSPVGSAPSVRVCLRNKLSERHINSKDLDRRSENRQLPSNKVCSKCHSIVVDHSKETQIPILTGSSKLFENVVVNRLGHQTVIILYPNKSSKKSYLVLDLISIQQTLCYLNY